MITFAKEITLDLCIAGFFLLLAVGAAHRYNVAKHGGSCESIGAAAAQAK